MEEEEGFVFVRPLAEALSLFLLRFKGSLEGSVQRERERAKGRVEARRGRKRKTMEDRVCSSRPRHPTGLAPIQYAGRSLSRVRTEDGRRRGEGRKREPRAKRGSLSSPDVLPSPFLLTARKEGGGTRDPFSCSYSSSSTRGWPWSQREGAPVHAWQLSQL